ncbi:hypothetical protein [Paenibacillus sp. PAMC 26794]|uniref:hypothetical protein n=1 Tax=Paenibacillus sp. PAMC 26794 TaxID=1257080 RepID=UPI0002ED6776|nr:hypothetical protein [Paenibacillus sp. PAMC 26794]
METKMLFGVGLVFDTPEFGTIVMGAKEELDELLPSTIKEMIGKQDYHQKKRMGKSKYLKLFLLKLTIL